MLRAARKPTIVLLVRHGQTATTGHVLPGRAPGLHLSDDGRRQAEAELVARERRHNRMDLRPLPEQTRERYAAGSEDVQAGFVDAQDAAVEQADQLVSQVMSERGYPMDDFDQRAADISVDHPVVVDNYRAAHRVCVAVKHGEASTEEERQAMRHYRSLFDELFAAAAGDDARSTERTGNR